MTILSDALDLLRRPLRSTAPTRGRKPDPALPIPVTEGELVTALDRVRAERAGAEAVLAEAAARRERLLMVEGSDDLIHAAARDLDAANLLLERLDRVEPDLWGRLREVQHDARRAEWIAVRDAYLASVRLIAVAAAAFEAEHRPVLNAARAALVGAFPNLAGPDAPNPRALAAAALMGHAPDLGGAKVLDPNTGRMVAVLPVCPMIPAGAVAEFERAAELFAQLLHDPDPPPTPLAFQRATELSAEQNLLMFGRGPVDREQEFLLHDRYGKPREGVLAGEA